MVDTTIEIAITSLIWIFVLGNLAAAAVGVLALTSPAGLKSLSQRANIWVSSRRLGKPVTVEIDSESMLLSRPRTTGLLVTLGSGFVLVEFGRLFSSISTAGGADLLVNILALQTLPQAVGEILWLSISTVILLGAGIGVVLGILTFNRSRWLGDLKSRTDRNVSTRSWSKELEAAHSSTDHWMLERARLWGGIVALLALFVLVNLTPLIL